jgi:hypothetical protein
VGEEGCRAAQGVLGEVRGQGVADGGGGEVAFEPGGDSGGEVLRVGGGEEKTGVLAAEAGEEVGGGLEEGGGGTGGSGYGGEELAGRALVRVGPPGGQPGGVGGRSAVFGLRSTMPGLVAGDRAGDDPAAGSAFAGAAEVAVGLQFAQGGGDTGRALGEAGGEGLDIYGGAGGEGLDVDAESDRESGQLRVLGEVVADHREAGGVAGVVVHDAGMRAPVGVVFARDTGLGTRGRARVFGVHREGLLPRWSGPRRDR